MPLASLEGVADADQESEAPCDKVKLLLKVTLPSSDPETVGVALASLDRDVVAENDLELVAV